MVLHKFSQYTHYIYPLTVTVILSLIYNKYKSSDNHPVDTRRLISLS